MPTRLDDHYKKKKKAGAPQVNEHPPEATGPRKMYYGPLGDDETESEQWPRRPKDTHGGGT